MIHPQRSFHSCQSKNFQELTIKQGKASENNNILGKYNVDLLGIYKGILDYMRNVIFEHCFGVTSHLKSQLKMICITKLVLRPQNRSVEWKSQQAMYVLLTM